MPIYKVTTFQMEEYENIVQASSTEEAKNIAMQMAYSKGASASDSYWYDSEIINQWDDNDARAPETDN